MIQIQNLSVNYAARRVLTDINLQVQEGEILALLGPNGSGKSTLLRAICSAIPSARGTISISAQNINSLKPAERARMISVVPQNAMLPAAFTAWETVLLGRTPHINFLGRISPRDETIARAALEKVDALALADRFMGELSGGEQQRILLARALSQAAPILLLDEPTTYLDLQHQMSLLSLVRKLAQEEGLTILIALHDLNLAARCADRVLLLVNGQQRALGTVKQVLRADVIADAYSWPVQVIDHPFQDAPLILPGLN